jgi:hypothetical protein
LNDDGLYYTSAGDIIRPLKDLVAWWVDKAERFKDNPWVWFNIMNEPGAGNTLEEAEMWYHVHDVVIQAIRDTGAENIIVLDDHNWGQAAGYFGGRESYDSAVIRKGPALLEKYGNLVFSLHVYGAWTDGASRFDRYFNDAKELGLAVVLGEYGVMRNCIGTHNAVWNMLNAALDHNIGRIYWAWDDNALPLVEGENGRGYMIDRTDGEMPGNLTWVGEMVWLDNRGLLTAPIPMFDLGLPLVINHDFEDGMTAWHNWGGVSVVQGASHDGSACLLVERGVVGGGGQTVHIQPNTTYRFTVWGKGNAQVGVKFRIDDSDPYERHEGIDFNDDEWVERHIEFTTPNEIFGASIYIWKSGRNVEFFLDDVRLEVVE